MSSGIPAVASVLLVLTALTWPDDVAGQSGGVVRGQVRSESNGMALRGAVVELSSDAGISSALSDADGRYSIAVAGSGRGTLRARYLGHEALELQIVFPASDSLVVDLLLAVQPITIDAVSVEGIAAVPGARDSAPAEAPDLGIAGAHALAASPGLAEVGLADGRGLPDPEPGDPGSVLYVRGAANDLKLVYLDGAPVYAPFPLGALLDPFTPGLLNRADIYLGGAPARYDGGLSYVMDLRSRGAAATGLRFDGAADLLSARALLEGGVGGRIGLLASARGVHSGASSGLFGDPLPYAYTETFLRADASLRETTALSLTGFRNDESVGMGRALDGDSTIAWGNLAGSVRLRTEFAATVAEVSVAAGDYSARLPLPGERPLVADGFARRSRIATDLVSSTAGLVFRYGGSVDHQRYRASTSTAEEGATAAYSEGGGTVTGVYLEGIGGLSQRVHIRAGGRIDHFSTTGDLTVAPRFAATLLISERAALTLAAGRYHQYLRPPDETVLAAAAGPPSTYTQPLTVGSASHLTVGLDQDLGDGIRIGIEGFYKDFSDVPGAAASGANASGVDLWVRRGAGPWTGWLGYSLAWAWSPAAGHGSAEFTGRHLLSSGFSTGLGDRTALDLRFAYGAGLPFSPVSLDPGENLPSRASTNFASDADPRLMAANRGGTETAPLLQPPDRPFLRVDAGISQTWRPRVAGRATHLRPYLKVLNGLGRRDALFYYHDAASDDDRPRPIGRLPVLPVAGLEWRF